MGYEGYNILICDDDKAIVDAVSIYLSGEGYSVYKAYDGAQVFDIIQKEQIHLVLLDIMMPVMDGLEVTKMIREQSGIPIIFMSAKAQDEDKIQGLQIGADDYITKPFNPRELVARVNSMVRRYTKLGAMPADEANSYRTGGLVISDDKKKVTVDGRDVRLTPLEYNILLFLVKNQGKVYTINEIYENIWNEEAFGADNTVAVHIRHIREKIEVNPKNPQYLKVVWGWGYKVEKYE